eukprot:CAMPEP_0184483460 /NCGR_PEP_ID=MMETSP0113_2-20130426/5115_1 /TAXON_ID=91329 /ORGANISM="Norrisiella sphaerica, Strain BC52" /LENGTH=1115 /DNA_ID=CAMNT_0026863877 /DNA_START=343 /DNA_END=3690 /DNA_ORIENTATION=-
MTKDHNFLRELSNFKNLAGKLRMNEVSTYTRLECERLMNKFCSSGDRFTLTGASRSDRVPTKPSTQKMKLQILNTYLKACARTGNLEEAKLVFGLVEEPTYENFISMLETCAKTGDIEEMLNLSRAMVSASKHPCNMSKGSPSSSSTPTSLPTSSPTVKGRVIGEDDAAVEQLRAVLTACARAKVPEIAEEIWQDTRKFSPSVTRRVLGSREGRFSMASAHAGQALKEYAKWMAEEKSPKKKGSDKYLGSQRKRTKYEKALRSIENAEMWLTEFEKMEDEDYEDDGAIEEYVHSDDNDCTYRDTYDHLTFGPSDSRHIDALETNSSANKRMNAKMPDNAEKHEIDKDVSMKAKPKRNPGFTTLEENDSYGKLCGQLLDTALKLGQLNYASRFLERLICIGRATEVMYRRVMKEHGKVGNAQVCEQLFVRIMYEASKGGEKMSKAFSAESKKDHRSSKDSLSEDSQSRRASQLKSVMIPSTETINEVLESWAKEKKVSEISNVATREMQVDTPIEFSMRKLGLQFADGAPSPGGLKRALWWLEKLHNGKMSVDLPLSCNSTGHRTLRENGQRSHKRILRPNAWSYSVVIQACCREGDMKSAQKWMRALREYEKAHDESVGAFRTARRTAVIAVISSLAQRKQVLQAERWLSMLEQEDGASLMTYNTVMKAHCVCGRPDRAENLLNTLLAQAENASAHADVGGDKKKLDSGQPFHKVNVLEYIDGIELDRRKKYIFKPNAYSFNMVIEGYARIGDFDNACKLLKIMGDMADEASYASVIKACGNAGNFVIAKRTFDEMKARGFVPAAEVYAALISALARSEDEEDVGKKAEILLSEMHELPLPSRRDNTSVAPYNALINVYAQKGPSNDPEKAEHWLKVLERRQGGAPPPTIVSYNTVLAAYARKSQSVDSERIFRRITEKSIHVFDEEGNPCKGIEPDVVTYNTTIEALISDKRPKKAFQRLKELLVHDSLKADRCSFALGLKALSLRKDVQAAENLVKSMIQIHDILPDEWVYYVLVSIFLRTNDTTRIIRWIPHLAFQASSMISKRAAGRSKNVTKKLLEDYKPYVMLNGIAKHLQKHEKAEDLNRFGTLVSEGTNGLLKLQIKPRVTRFDIRA